MGDDAVISALSAWLANRDSEAVQLLITGRSILGPAAPDPSGAAVLQMTEEDFTALPPGDRTKVQAEALRLATAAKALARRALAEGDAAAADDAQMAAKHYEGVLRLGECLAQADRLTVLKMVGDALAASAREKLAAGK
jgi:hypothetical protein